MKPLFRSICFIASAAAIFGLAAVTPGLARQAAAPRPPTAEEYGREPALAGLSLAPDGKHIAAIVSAPGQPNHIAVWSTETPNAQPTRIGCGKSDCISVDFVKKDRIAVQVRQLYTSGNEKTHLFRFFTTDLEGKEWRNADGSTDQTAFAAADVVDLLPKDPQNILVVVDERRTGTTVIPDGGTYKLNVYTGAKSKVRGGSDKYFSEQWDTSREVRARQSLEFENGNAYLIQWIKDTKGQWAEHFRWYPKDREQLNLVGFTSDPNVVYIATNKGRDKTGIFEYDIAARQMKDLVFETKFFDASGVVESDSASDEGALLGFRYFGESGKVYWVDPQIAAMEKGAREALGAPTVPVQWTDIATGEKGKFRTPDGFDVRIAQWSDDRKVALVVKNGASQPTEYYLMTDGSKLALLGKARPWIDTRILGDMRLVQYAARDGLMVPAFLTTPKKEIYGPGPYPTLIVPHGGPWVRDSLGYDSSGWVQYFAARGYAVLQPQYRGSRFWGQKLWLAGDKEWGLKMQDDKDDGAKWLIAQGIADPNRIAMHGYSYGGYAAMTASIRPNGLYQCAIAGAGVASLEKFRTQALGNRIQREYQRPSLEGMSPIDHVKDVSIPILLYHGDRDTNVDIEESERFVSGLKSSGKPYKFVTIPNMGHEADKWAPGDIAAVLTLVENYLTTDCGPGGL